VTTPTNRSTTPPVAAAVLTGMAGDLQRLAPQLMRLLNDIAGSDDEDLSWRKVSVLRRLADKGPASASLLATLERVRPQSMSVTIAALEDQGLVSRSPHPHDKRAILIHLTQRGQDIMSSAVRARDDQVASLLQATYRPEEFGQLGRAIELLERLVDGD
jgi:DNA-binding MarR family transcriptional regulator